MHSLQNNSEFTPEKQWLENEIWPIFRATCWFQKGWGTGPWLSKSKIFCVPGKWAICSTTTWRVEAFPHPNLRKILAVKSIWAKQLKKTHHKYVKWPRRDNIRNFESSEHSNFEGQLVNHFGAIAYQEGSGLGGLSWVFAENLAVWIQETVWSLNTRGLRRTYIPWN